MRCLGVGDRIQAPYRLWLPDLHRRLHVVELTDLDARHERWMQIQGDPWVWFPVDWRTFGVWPIPAAGAGWLQVDAICWPDDVQDDVDEPRDLAALRSRGARVLRRDGRLLHPGGPSARDATSQLRDGRQSHRYSRCTIRAGRLLQKSGC